MLSGVGLKHTSYETMWEEEPSEPEARWVARRSPVSHESDSLL